MANSANGHSHSVPSGSSPVGAPPVESSSLDSAAPVRSVTCTVYPLPQQEVDALRGIHRRIAAVTDPQARRAAHDLRAALRRIENNRQNIMHR